jgi:sarcosine oxidase/L-pipecolate oxidase
LVTYLDYITHLVSSQRQVDAIYFDFSSAFDLVSHTLLLGKLSSFGLASAYVGWFSSYLTDRFSCVKISGIFSAPFRILAGVPQGSGLGTLLFNIYIDDICNVLIHSFFLLI